MVLGRKERERESSWEEACDAAPLVGQFPNVTNAIRVCFSVNVQRKMMCRVCLAVLRLLLN